MKSEYYTPPIVLSLLNRAVTDDAARELSTWLFGNPELPQHF